MQKTKLQIIEETYEAYKDASNRAYDHDTGMCVYANPLGDKKCAFGRCEVNPPTGRNGSVETRFGFRHAKTEWEKQAAENDMDAALKEEYRGHPLQFWQDLQNLHDEYSNFIDGQWSYKGLARIDELKKLYAEN